MAAVTVAQATATAQEAVTTDGAALPLIEDPTRVSPQDARELSRQFFDRLVMLEEGTEAYQYVRNTLIEMNLSLVRYAASRFRARGTRWRTSSRSEPSG